MKRSEWEAFLAEQRRKDEFQNEQLKHIVWLLKGNPEMHIEGVIPEQKRMELMVREVLDWKHKIDIFTSGRLWKWIFKGMLTIGAIYILVRYGLKAAIEFFKLLII